MSKFKTKSKNKTTNSSDNELPADTKYKQFTPKHEYNTPDKSKLLNCQGIKYYIDEGGGKQFKQFDKWIFSCIDCVLC